MFECSCLSVDRNNMIDIGVRVLIGNKLIDIYKYYSRASRSNLRTTCSVETTCLSVDVARHVFEATDAFRIRRDVTVVQTI